MSSDKRRGRQPPELGSGRVPARVQPPGPSMEEWQATIERELTGSMPLSNRAVQSHDIDRWWHGPGLYGGYGRRAVSTLRAEYLNDHDFAYGAPAGGDRHDRMRPGAPL